MHCYHNNCSIVATKVKIVATILVCWGYSNKTFYVEATDCESFSPCISRRLSMKIFRDGARARRVHRRISARILNHWLARPASVHAVIIRRRWPVPAARRLPVERPLEKYRFGHWDRSIALMLGLLSIYNSLRVSSHVSGPSFRTSR